MKYCMGDFGEPSEKASERAEAVTVSKTTPRDVIASVIAPNVSVVKPFIPSLERTVNSQLSNGLKVGQDNEKVQTDYYGLRIKMMQPALIEFETEDSVERELLAEVASFVANDEPFFFESEESSDQIDVKSPVMLDPTLNLPKVSLSQAIQKSQRPLRAIITETKSKSLSEASSKAKSTEDKKRVEAEIAVVRKEISTLKEREAKILEILKTRVIPSGFQMGRFGELSAEQEASLNKALQQTRSDIAEREALVGKNPVNKKLLYGGVLGITALIFFNKD